MSSLFKRAAVRGIAHELVNKGICEFPSKEAMDEAADAVADGPVGEQMPEVSGPEGHSPEQLAQAAQKLMEIAQALMQEAQGAAGGAPGGPPPPPVAQGMGEVKAACARDISTVAGETAMACMDKAAEESKVAGDPKLVGVSGHSKNDLANSAKIDSVAALDNKLRPQGKYQVAQGDTALDAAKGNIGHLGKTTVAPTNSPGGSNSITKGKEKSAEELRDIVQKHANKLVGLHDTKKNTLANSPDALAKLDLKNRAEGKYKVAPGGANFSEPQAARIGIEKKPDVSPSNSPAGSNSVTQASKAAEEEEYLQHFEATAADVGAYLPASFSEDEKVAAINEMIPLDHAGREAKLNELAKTASEKAPTEPAEGQKKESGLLARVREIANKAGGQATQA